MASSPQPPESQDALAEKVGGAAAGLIGGMVLGFAVAAIFAALFDESLNPVIVFGTAALGALVGYLSVAAGLGVFEGAAHFSIGWISAIAERWPIGNERSTAYLKWLTALGFALGIVALVMWRW
jgi:hypothetical protein